MWNQNFNGVYTWIFTKDKQPCPQGILSRGADLELQDAIPNSKVHGANMRPIWGRQGPGGPHVGIMNLVIWDVDLPKDAWSGGQAATTGTLSSWQRNNHDMARVYVWICVYTVFWWKVKTDLFLTPWNSIFSFLQCTAMVKSVHIYSYIFIMKRYQYSMKNIQIQNCASPYELFHCSLVCIFSWWLWIAGPCFTTILGQRLMLCAEFITLNLDWYMCRGRFSPPTISFARNGKDLE